MFWVYALAVVILHKLISGVFLGVQQETWGLRMYIFFYVSLFMRLLLLYYICWLHNSFLITST